MQSSINTTVQTVASASATLDATINRAADLISTTFRDRSPLERLAEEIAQAGARAEAQRNEARDLLAGFAGWLGAFESELTAPTSSAPAGSIDLAPTLDSPEAEVIFQSIGELLSAPFTPPQDEEVVTTAALPAQAESPAVPLTPTPTPAASTREARLFCPVCGKGGTFHVMPQDEDKLQCGGCLEEGKGFVLLQESKPVALTVPAVSKVRTMKKAELVELAKERGIALNDLESRLDLVKLIIADLRVRG